MAEPFKSLMEIGASGPRRAGGWFVPGTESAGKWTSLAKFQTTWMPVARITLQPSFADTDVQFIGYIDKAQTYSVVLGQCRLAPGNAYVLAFDLITDAMEVKFKTASAGTTVALSGGWNGTNQLNTLRTSVSHEEFVVTSAQAIQFTRAALYNILEAIVTVEDNPIRFTLDGTAPTTTSGHLLLPGDVLKITSALDIINFQTIAPGGLAKLTVTYFR